MPENPATPAPVKQEAKQARTVGFKKGQSGNKATQFKPGQSGNPHGRPKNEQCLTALLRQEIARMCPADKDGRTWAQLIVLATMRLAMAGNSTALKEIWERLDGKVTTPLEIDTPTGQPLIRVKMVPARTEPASQPVDQP